MTGNDVKMTPGWRKSSYSFSNGNCAEVAAWRTSSYTYGGSNCAEAGHAPGAVAVRDTKDRGGVVLTVPAAAWTAFTRSLKAGTS